MGEYDIGERVKTIIDYINSPQGQAELKRRLDEAAKVNEYFKRARQIEISDLLEPMTI